MWRLVSLKIFKNLQYYRRRCLHKISSKSAILMLFIWHKFKTGGKNSGSSIIHPRWFLFPQKLLIYPPHVPCSRIFCPQNTFIWTPRIFSFNMGRIKTHFGDFAGKSLFILLSLCCFKDERFASLKDSDSVWESLHFPFKFA